MQRIVINDRYGVFGLSDAAYERLAELGVPVKPWDQRSPIDSDAVIYDFDQGKPLGTLTGFQRKVQGRYCDYWFNPHRDDVRLVQIVEELGDGANGVSARLKIVEIPDDAKWEIEEDDGKEWIAEVHQTWN